MQLLFEVNARCMFTTRKNNDKERYRYLRESNIFQILRQMFIFKTALVNLSTIVLLLSNI